MDVLRFLLAAAVMLVGVRQLVAPPVTTAVTTSSASNLTPPVTTTMTTSSASSLTPLQSSTEDLRLRVVETYGSYCALIHASLPGVEQYQDPSERCYHFAAIVKPMTSLPDATQITNSSEAVLETVWHDLKQLHHILEGSKDVGYSILKSKMECTLIGEDNPCNLFCDEYRKPEQELYCAIQSLILPRLANVGLLIELQLPTTPTVGPLIDTDLQSGTSSTDVRYYLMTAIQYAKDQASATKEIVYS